MAEFSAVIIFDIETNDLETLPYPDRRYSSRASENADFRPRLHTYPALCTLIKF